MDASNGSIGSRTSARAVVIVAVVALVVIAAVAAAWVARSDALPVISLAGGSGDDGLRAASADAAPENLAYDDLTMWAPVEYRFELGEGAQIASGEATAWQLVVPSDLEAAAGELAERFELGDVRPAPYAPDSFLAGPEDGSGPTLWVGSSGEWSYSDPGDGMRFACPEPGLIEPEPADRDADGGKVDSADGDASSDADGNASSDVGGDAEAPLVDEPRIDLPACETPDPPTGVPSADEARALATELFDDLDLPGEVTLSDVYADEWGAWVQGTIALDGLATELWVGAGWGGDAALTSVNASLAQPTRVGDYPTIDAEAAVERLADGSAWGGSPRAMPLPADAAVTDTAPSVDDGPALEDGPVSDDTPVSDEAPAPDELPTDPEELLVDPLPDERDRELQIVTVSLTAVEPILMLQWDTDATMWLLPGYRFTDSDGGTWAVLAVADEYLVTDEDVVPDPGVVEPDVPPPGFDESVGDGMTGGGSEPSSGQVEPSPPDALLPDDEAVGPGEPEPPLPDMEVDPALERLAAEVVGLSEQDATERIEAQGGIVRVIRRDDEQPPMTNDYSNGRVNLQLEAGIVVDASIG